MLSEEDKTLLKRVVETGLASQAQVDSLLKDVTAIEGLAGDVDIADLMVKKGLCTRPQLDKLTAQTPAAEDKNQTPDDVRPEHDTTAEGHTSEVGGFKVINRIGRGGMGAVFRAKQVSMDRIVALKVLAPDLVENKTYVDRFIREARSAARLDHPNIVRGIDAGHDRGYYYLAMELVDGEALSKKVKREGKLPESEALKIGARIASALDHALTSAGLVHRDVKPDNILIAKDGTPKLADLGLAKSAEDQAAGVTRIGATVGTPHYLSPEQACGESEVDTRSDIYALGATLYHLLTGSPPFKGTTPQVVLSKHINEDPVPPREINPDISRAAEAIIMRMLDKDPDRRYQTPSELEQDLKRALAGKEPAQAKPAPVAMRVGPSRVSDRLANRSRRNSTGYVIAVIFAVVAGLVIAVALSREPNTNRPEPKPDKQPVDKQKLVEEEAREKLDAAKTFAENNSKRYREAAGRFRGVAEDYESTQAGEEAAKLMNLWRKKWIDAADKEFARVKAETDDLIAEGEYGAALKRSDQFPERLLTKHVQQKQTKLSQDIRERANEQFNSICSKAEELAGEQRFDEAIDLLATVGAMKISDITKEAEQLTETIREQSEAHATEKQRLATELLTKLDKDLTPVLRARDYDRAEMLLHNARQSNVAEEVEDELDSRRAVVDALKGFWKKANEGAGKTIGSTRMVQGHRGKVSEIIEGRIMVDVGGVHLPVDMKAMTGRELARLAGYACRDDDGGDRLVLAAFWMVEGETEEAEAQFKAAEKLGEDTAPLTAMLNVFAKAKREQIAAQLLDQATQAKKEQDWEKAIELTERLYEAFAETDFVKTNDGRIQALQAEAKARFDRQPSRRLVNRLKRIDERAKELEENGYYADALELRYQFADLEFSRERMKRALNYCRKTLPVTIRLGDNPFDYGLKLVTDEDDPTPEVVTMAGKSGFKLPEVEEGEQPVVIRLNAYRGYKTMIEDIVTVGVEVCPLDDARLGVTLVRRDELGEIEDYPVRPLASIWGTKSWRIVKEHGVKVRFQRELKETVDIRVFGSNIVVRSVWLKIPRGSSTPLTRLMQDKLPRMRHE